MITGFLTALVAFFQAVPAISQGINAFTSAYFNAKVQLTAARIGGDVSIAKTMVTGIVAEGQVRVSFLQTVSQSKFLMFIVGGFAIPPMVFMAKCIIWDNVLHLGHTDPLGGDVATLTNIIVTGIFGAGSVMGIGHMYFNRNKTGE